MDVVTCRWILNILLFRDIFGKTILYKRYKYKKKWLGYSFH
jgi:hypothetical protein